MTKELPHNADVKSDFMDKVWSDPAFAQALKTDPKATLKELGRDFPEDLEVKVVFDSDKVKYLHVPAPPSESEVSDAELLDMQGGTTPHCVTVNTIIGLTSTIVTINSLN